MYTCIWSNSKLEKRKFELSESNVVRNIYRTYTPHSIRKCQRHMFQEITSFEKGTFFMKKKEIQVNRQYVIVYLLVILIVILCIVQSALKQFPLFFLQGTQATVQGLVKTLSCIRASTVNARLKVAYTPLYTHLFLIVLSM